MAGNTEDVQITVLRIMRDFRRMVDSFQSRNTAIDAGLLMPETSGARAREFATTHDRLTREFMALFPDMSAPDWEMFVDFLPNVRKLL